MCRVALSVIFLAASLLPLAGCESHEAKIDRLQKEYDKISQQFGKDCSAEYLKVPPNLSQKCVDESKQMGEAGKRLREERTKQ
jgi:hypothetical protein